MAYKHTQEPALDSCAITIHPKLELKYKLLLLTKYKKSPSKAVEEICLQATKGIKLRHEEVNAIQQDIECNRKKRMVNRIKVAEYNHRFATGNFRKGV